MQKKLLPIVYLVVAIGVALAAYFIFSNKKINTPDINIKDMVTRDAINPVNTTQLKTDSFKVLAKRAYGDLLKIDESGNNLLMQLDNTNKLSSDFFNSNDALLKFKKGQSGFEIAFDKENGTVNATFVENNDAVNVPNDVLIMMMQKAYNR